MRRPGSGMCELGWSWNSGRPALVSGGMRAGDAIAHVRAGPGRVAPLRHSATNAPSITQRVTVMGGRTVLSSFFAPAVLDYTLRDERGCVPDVLAWQFAGEVRGGAAE